MWFTNVTTRATLKKNEKLEWAKIVKGLGVPFRGDMARDVHDLGDPGPSSLLVGFRSLDFVPRLGLDLKFRPV